MNNNKKRPAGSPVQSENNKELRFHSPKMTSNQAATDIQMAGDGGIEEERPGRHLRADSVSSNMSTSSSTVWKEETEGPMRVYFTVDLLTRNGLPYKGNITSQEALNYIFTKSLGFKSDECHAITPGYKANPFVGFRTKQPFNIDEKLQGKSIFEYEKMQEKKDGTFELVKVGCGIKGIREKAVEFRSRETSRYTFVKIEGAEYQLKEETVKRWLSNFGTLMDDIVEDEEKLCVEGEEGGELKEIVNHTGTYTAKMALNKPIPHLLPMDGKRIKIYYRGISKLCGNCFRQGHKRETCQRIKRDWLDYLDEFMLNHDFDDDMYGSWIKRIENWRVFKKDLHNANIRRKEEKDQNRAKEVNEINLIREQQKNQNRGAGEKGDEEVAGSSTVTGEFETQAEAQREEEWQLVKSPKSKRKDAKEEKKMVDINSLTLEEVGALMKIKRAERGIEIAAKRKNQRSQIVNKPTAKPGTEKEANSTESLQSNCSTGEDVVDE